MKILIKASILCIITVFAAVITSCEKEDTNENSDNQTNHKSTAVFNPDKTYGTLIDQDGNVYKTIKIGNQTWMAENLRTTKYRDGSEVPVVTSNDAWFDLSTGACCNYNNTISNDTISTYGRLYNSLAITDSRKLAPEGWHIPNNEEWSILRDYLGGSLVAGGKLKEVGFTHWLEKNAVSTNESGFTAIPGGYRNGVGMVLQIGEAASWWSFDYESEYPSWDAAVRYNNNNITLGTSAKGFGFSIRCIKD